MIAVMLLLAVAVTDAAAAVTQHEARRIHAQARCGLQQKVEHNGITMKMACGACRPVHRQSNIEQQLLDNAHRKLCPRQNGRRVCLTVHS
eukprot:6204553-Pleurochrysis_carterae.AAC.3